MVFVAMLSSAVIAIWQYKNGAAFIAQLMGISWGALAGAFLGPYIYGLVLEARLKGFGLGELHFCRCVYVRQHSVQRAVSVSGSRSPINCGTVTTLFSLVIVPIGKPLYKGAHVREL